MKAISIRQPWAWLVAMGVKDIENRTWPTKHRGRTLIHAGQTMTRREYADVADFVRSINRSNLIAGSGAPPIILPEFENLERGGIIGTVDIHDCILPERRVSHWHMEGQHGFALRDATRVRFKPYHGQLGIFYVPDGILKEPAHLKESADACVR